MNLLNSNNGTESGMSTKDLKMNANETKVSTPSISLLLYQIILTHLRQVKGK